MSLGSIVSFAISTTRRGLQLHKPGCFWGLAGSARGLPPDCCGDTESALFAAEVYGLEGTGCEVSVTINTGALGVGVAVIVTVTVTGRVKVTGRGWFVIRKSWSMHFRHAFQEHDEHLCLP